MCVCVCFSGMQLFIPFVFFGVGKFLVMLGIEVWADICDCLLSTTHLNRAL